MNTACLSPEIRIQYPNLVRGILMRGVTDWQTRELLMDVRSLMRLTNMQLQQSRESIQQTARAVQATSALVARTEQAIRESEGALERLKFFAGGGASADHGQSQDHSGDLIR
jgi:hypothetical protein